MQIQQRGVKHIEKSEREGQSKVEITAPPHHHQHVLTWSSGALHHPLNKENGANAPSSPFVSQSRRERGLWTFGRATLTTAGGASAN